MNTKRDMQTEPQQSLPTDPSMAGMASLLDPGVMLEVLRKLNRDASRIILACRVAHVRYKPMTNCVVAYRIESTDKNREAVEESWLYAKSYTAGDFTNAVSKAESKSKISHRWLDTPVILPDLKSVLYDMTDDTLLTGLRTVFNARKLVRVIHDGLAEFPRDQYRISDTRMKVTTVRYKPEKRAVFRIETRIVHKLDRGDRHVLRLYLRTYSDNQGESVFGLMSRLHKQYRSNAHLIVPTPISYSDDKRLLLMHGVDGVPLLTPPGEPMVPAAITRSARALAEMHQFADQNTGVRTLAEVLDDAAVAAAGLIAVAPELEDRAGRLLSDLRTQSVKSGESSGGFVHGDFHHGQVLDRVDGRAAILDFDRSYVGDQYADLGNFIAHLHMLELSGGSVDRPAVVRSFLSAYEDHIRKALDPDRVRYWTAFGLFLLAIFPFRSLEPNWRQKVTAIVSRCEELV